MANLDFFLSDGCWSSGFDGFVALFLSSLKECIGFTDNKVTTSVLLLMAHLILTDFVSTNTSDNLTYESITDS